MSRILSGVLQPGARTIGIGVTGARRGVAMFSGVPQAVVVKACTPPELAAECFCALLAGALSVNTPPCGVVFENGVPHFASVYLSAPNLMQQFCVDTTQHDQGAAMNSSTAVTGLTSLPTTVGQWRAIYWEPVMATGERICIGFLTTWDGQSKAVLTVRPDLLSILFGAAGARAHALLERALRITNARLAEVSVIDTAVPPMTGLHFGPVETSHVNSFADLIQIGKLMSSSLATMAEPDHPDAADAMDAGGEPSQPARQFATRVRDLVLERNVRLAGCFNKEAVLIDARRPVRFGFLSDSLVAQFGLLQPTRINSHVRMARGLIAELSLAKRAGGRSNLLILGFPPLASATLTDKERSAIADYTHELGLEAREFDVGFAAADSDTQARDALLAAI